MLHYLSYLMSRFNPEPTTRSEPAREPVSVVIRHARDSDMALLRDLARLDSARPLRGPALVALVEGHVWAAIGLDDQRAIADPFLPAAPAVELLRLRVEQLCAADGRPQRGALPRWIAGRVRA